MTTGEMIIQNKMTGRANGISLRSAAFLAGVGLLIMVIAAPFAELYVYPRLIIPGNAAGTVKNILANRSLFTAAIFGYLITFICDVLVAWALYVFLRPVNEHISRLTAWFRLIYTMIALVALLNLVSVLRLLDAAAPMTLFQPEQLQGQVMLSLNAFRSDWNFGLLFFGIHLGLLGYLVIRSRYIPSLVGVLLMIAGAGYLLNTLRPFLFPDINLKFAEYTYYGELIFMLWLLIKGPGIKETN